MSHKVMVNSENVPMRCPFSGKACGKWCPMLGYENPSYFCQLSVTRHGAGQPMAEACGIGCADLAEVMGA